MRKAGLLLILLTAYFSGKAQYEKSAPDNFVLFRTAVKEFIASVQYKSPGTSRYNVYTVDMYNTPPADSNAFCFVISYFTNTHESTLLRSQCFFTIDSEIVLVNFPNVSTKKWLSKGYIKIVDSMIKKEVREKLFPENAGTILAEQYPSLLFWYDGQKIRKRFFEDSEDIPSKIDFSNFPDGPSSPLQRTFAVPEPPVQSKR